MIHYTKNWSITYGTNVIMIYIYFKTFHGIVYL